MFNGESVFKFLIEESRNRKQRQLLKIFYAYDKETQFNYLFIYITYLTCLFRHPAPDSVRHVAEEGAPELGQQRAPVHHPGVHRAVRSLYTNIFLIYKIFLCGDNCWPCSWWGTCRRGGCSCWRSCGTPCSSPAGPPPPSPAGMRPGSPNTVWEQYNWQLYWWSLLHGT